ncbi:group II intron maturase-specific domain-containing protein [Streptomyces albiflavescens]|uniref:group II intron maturase-specific domain-containing protein n=1 Tax=Streptomyces albiflavescens TaxID=1623582 RepID=UPI00357143EC
MTDLSFKELARRINPVVAGWINYYGRFGDRPSIPPHVRALALHRRSRDDMTNRTTRAV